MTELTVEALYREKPYHELTFTDNFMFCKIMEKNPELCRQMLEIILEIKIDRIVFVGREETLGVTPEGKSVRLDVYVSDENGTVYDIEMQASNSPNLPKRTRYYQGMIDLNMIEKGMDYSDLKKSFIIFICMFDFFGKGESVYTFTNQCRELPGLELGDDTVKVFLNPHGDTGRLSEDMRTFLRYLKGESENGNEFIGKLEKEVELARSSEEWKVEYMTLMMEYRERYKEGKEAGIRQGIEQGIEAFVLDNVEDGVSRDKVLLKLQKRFRLSEEKAAYYYNKFSVR